ncbi:hypothetical protein [Phormidesmis sp. 146-33]
MALAKVLAKEENGQKLIAQYQKRIQNFKQALGDRRDQIQVSVAGMFPEFVHGYGEQSTVGMILKDLELQRPPS